MAKKKSLLNRLAGFDQIKTGFDYTRFSLSRLLSHDEERREESFEEACRRFNITGTAEEMNAILLKRFKSLKKVFIWKFIMAIFMFGLAIFNLTMGSFLGVIVAILVGLIILIMSMSDSFRCFQINERSLGLLRTWFYSPKKWWPSQFKETDFSVLPKTEQEVE